MGIEIHEWPADDLTVLVLEKKIWDSGKCVRIAMRREQIRYGEFAPTNQDTGNQRRSDGPFRIHTGVGTSPEDRNMRRSLSDYLACVKSRRDLRARHSGHQN